MMEILPEKRGVSDLVYAYRMVQGEGKVACSLRDFARLLNEVLVIEEMEIVHQTVSNWERRRSLPSWRLLHVLLGHAPDGDWRHDFAQDMLAALQPEAYRPATLIGRLALQRSVIETGPQKMRYGDWYLT